SVQIIEPTLEKLYISSLTKVKAAIAGIEKVDKIFDPIKIIAGSIALIFSFSVAFTVSTVISKSVIQSKSFAEQIASGDLTHRLTPRGRNEFATLALALNHMAGILQNAENTQKKWMDELSKSEQRFRAIFENASDGILLYDPETGKFYDSNKMICQMLGYSSEEIKNLGVMDIYSEKDLPYVIKQFEEQTKQERKLARDLPIKRKDGTLFYADVNTSHVVLSGKIYIMGIFRDITERKQSESQIRYLAYYDSLTGLPNRTFLKELFKKAIDYAQRYNLMVAILYLDLDDFKRINDTLGHNIGDKLLQAVSERLVDSVRRSDIVASLTEGNTVVSRFGGDEFVILLYHIKKIYDAGTAASRILKEISKPFKINEHEVFTSASIGISLYPSSGENIDDLLKNVDTAMYNAKSKGKNNYQIYSPAMNAAALEVFNLERDLHRAIERQEFLLYYQPKLDTLRRKIVGMEALIRWKHTEKGMIVPTKFIPLAEDSGLIIPIGEWTLFTACMQTKSWQEAGFKITNISVNLSTRQFDQKNLPSIISRVLSEAALSPQHLELEITESTVMRNPEEAISILHKLKNMGVQISIDDFGTGYSSLNYLRQLPIDSLKIDRSFVINVATNPGDANIVKGIIALAHSLKLNVIAEGVETEEQFDFLRNTECDEVQGYLFSKPLPAEEISNLLLKDGI
ncbi:MAG: EAL domain-containing protein, partial [Planctomycetes bacterium]|nr:EAL domain-containing protein [Planctomycetota bacterium]